MEQPLSFDLVVIGAGAAGLVSSGFAASLGLKVALIADGPPGGECLWTGCVPSKALIHKAQEVHTARRYFAGIDLAAEFNRAMQHMNGSRDTISKHESAQLLRSKYGITVIDGRAYFEDSRTLIVKDQRITAHKFIVATGSKTRIPDIPGLKDTDYLTHETILQLSRVPASVVFLGGGPVSVEYAQTLARFGVSVTLIEKNDRLLKKEDPEASAAIATALDREGVKIYLGAKVRSVSKGNGVISVEMSDQHGERTLQAQHLFLGLGKEASTQELRPEAAGIALRADGFIHVNRYQHTSSKYVWACGDVCGPPFFTHYADHCARVAVLNACLSLPVARDESVIPRCTFTDPEVAAVGLTEEQSRVRYEHTKVFRLYLQDFDRSIIDETGGFVKVMTKKNGTILGATIVASRAGELIHEIALAIKKHLTVQDLSSLIHAYPTMNSAIWNLSSLAHGEIVNHSWQSHLLKSWAACLR